MIISFLLILTEMRSQGINKIIFNQEYFIIKKLSIEKAVHHFLCSNITCPLLFFKCHRLAELGFIWKVGDYLSMHLLSTVIFRFKELLIQRVMATRHDQIDTTTCQRWFQCNHDIGEARHRYLFQIEIHANMHLERNCISLVHPKKVSCINCDATLIW